MLSPLRTSLPSLRASAGALRTLRTSAYVAQGSNDGDSGSGSSKLFSRPGPPSLPPKEQREFEKLVKEKSNALQFTSAQVPSDGDPVHPDARRKPSPDFEGETNPETGEVGGPKKDPLTWAREWSYGGRATDF